jgi:subtilase family serine protease
MNKKGKIIGLALVAIMVVSLFAVAIPSITATENGKPDLTITNIWIVDNRIHYTIENIGTADAPTSYTGLYINGIYRARDRVAPLAVAATSNEVFGGHNYRGGDIKVCADYRRRIDELDENNNCNVLGPVPMPDLTITAKSEEALDDCRFNVTYTVENIGDGDANASNTTIYINGDKKMEDPVLELAAGDHYTNTVGPFNCTPCQPVQVIVEADNDKNVTESNEDNNKRENVFECPGPDLMIWYKYEEALDNCSFMVSYMVMNVGNCEANASNTTIYINDIEKMVDPVPELAVGEPYPSTVGPFNCTPCQPVQVTVKVDSNDNVTECREYNNEETNTYVCPGPDLIITAKSEEALDNCSFTVTYTVMNIGECNASASNTTIYINDIEQMKDPVGELAAGKDYTSTVGPFSCAPRTTLKITVKADGDNEVVECEECNNWKINDEFKCPAPDLVITEKTEVINSSDCTFMVRYTVENIGNCTANASDTTIWIDGVNVLEDPVGELAAGYSYPSTVGPFSCEPCTTLNITVEADNNDDVTECNESNNVMENEFKCPGPDLIITEKKETALDNCSFMVTYTVENIGNCTANASETTIYINDVNVLEDRTLHELDD